MRVLLALVPALLLAPGALFSGGGLLHGQESTRLHLEGPGGEARSVAVVDHRGYAALPSEVLEDLGWEIEVGGSGVTARLGDQVRVELLPSSPFFRWNEELFQLVEAPYFFGERLYVPVQLVTGFLPRMVEESYGWDAEGGVLRVLEPARWTPMARGVTPGPGLAQPGLAGPVEPGQAVSRRRSAEPGARPEAEEPAVTVVVIDPGHGGRDTGALGPAGVLEKDVALGVARALARELSGLPHVEVHLTREDDTLVPLWQRGEKATEWKGDRPGVFVSLHANAVSGASGVRGFETYFLSEARTEHERRVAALENSVVAMEGPDPGSGGVNPDLGFILSDLRNRDHQRRSAVLAQLIQEELRPVHPGPDRGVKQGPFAVITNALMPSVLVELGFLSHPSEAKLLSASEFQEDVARSLARALLDFIDRYRSESDPGAVGAPR